jgi:hypothetical protein
MILINVFKSGSYSVTKTKLFKKIKIDMFYILCKTVKP